MTETVLVWVAAAFLPFAIWYLRRLIHRPPAARLQPLPGLPDAFAASALAVWFVTLIAQAQGQTQEVSLSAVLGSVLIYGMLVAFLVGFLLIRGISARKFLGLWPLPTGRGMATALAGLAAGLPLIYLVQWSVSLAFGPETARQPLLEYWMEEAGWEGRVLVVIMALGIAPFAEEVLFRGYLFRVAERYAGRWPAMATVSLLFAGVHVHLPALGGLFVLAMVLNLLYVVTGSLWAPIAAHALFNMLTLILSLAWPESL